MAERDHSTEVSNEFLYSLLHPYPHPEQAIGICVQGDDWTLSMDTWVSMIKVSDESEVFSFSMQINPWPDNGQRERADKSTRRALELLNLPRIEEMLDDPDNLLQELPKHNLEADEAIQVYGNTNLATFEKLYNRLAQSDYVQLSELDQVVGYIIRDTEGANRDFYASVYRMVHPGNEVVPELFPFLARDLSQVGIVKLDPFEIYDFCDLIA